MTYTESAQSLSAILALPLDLSERVKLIAQRWLAETVVTYAADNWQRFLDDETGLVRVVDDSLFEWATEPYEATLHAAGTNADALLEAMPDADAAQMWVAAYLAAKGEAQDAYDQRREQLSYYGRM